MTNRDFRNQLCAAIGLLTLLTGVECIAASESQNVVKIHYLSQEQDQYYARERAYAGLDIKKPERPLPGVKTGLAESRIRGRALNLAFELVEVVVPVDTPAENILAPLLLEDQTGFVVVDLPREQMLSVVQHFSTHNVLFFNARLSDDDLRGEYCAEKLFHTIPSYAMLQDALAQFLRKKNWTRILLLQGPLPDDQAIATSFERAAIKMGLKIVEKREFLLSNNPKDRSQSNVQLMTAGFRYDAVYVSDSYGEFSRYVPYQTNDSRLVIGSDGLIPSAWHWTWERYGAPQLNQRFKKQTQRDKMSSGEWAGWAAIKSLVTAIVKTGSTNFTILHQYLTSAEMSLDLYKGVPGSFRNWNNQLRQSILLHTYNAVVESAPIDGFLHKTNNLDTLGIDQDESVCKFK